MGRTYLSNPKLIHAGIQVNPYLQRGPQMLNFLQTIDEWGLTLFDFEHPQTKTVILIYISSAVQGRCRHMRIQAFQVCIGITTNIIKYNYILNACLMNISGYWLKYRWNLCHYNSNQWLSGVCPVPRQAISWSNGDQVHWYSGLSLGLRTANERRR